MNKKKFEVPILFIIFRRKNTSLKVLDAISKVKPRKLYISQDGPRNELEKEEVRETREAVLSKINWDCKLTVWTHDNNLGLREHIPEAFNKFFKKEGVGIYLEDDTLPSKDFFYYQKELLERYKNDKRIFSINGTNFYPDAVKVEDSYYLSKMGSVWGFGLWKRSWKLYDSNMNDFNKVSDTERYRKYFFSRKYKFYLEMFWKTIKDGRLDSWAMQLVYTAVKNNMYFINPSANLVNNIGRSKLASNVSLQDYYHSYGNLLPLEHPESLEYVKKNDINYFRYTLSGGWLRLFLIKIYLFLPMSFKNIINRVFNK